MEEKEIKDLFANFEPELKPDFEFMAQLERNMEAVEMIRQRLETLRARSRRAMIIAACVGFMVGVVTTLVVPYLSGMLAAMHLPEAPVLSWLIVAAFTVLSSLTAYDLATSNVGVSKYMI